MKIPLLSQTLAKAFLSDDENDYLYKSSSSSKTAGVNNNNGFSDPLSKTLSGSNRQMKSSRSNSISDVQDNELLKSISKQQLFFGYIEKFDDLIPGKVENYRLQMTGFRTGVVVSLNDKICIYDSSVDGLLILRGLINLNPSASSYPFRVYLGFQL
ncbi:unnamed protein product [Ambrosiozyma monospora]|uniref:Unnamed protein product n=1 Tax=Ambrosiozyma monospora TaxID=43982 RepID=A0A9W6YZL7_AMBMO|nr:unnamed protein product [Ambrosiozyma monospora]